VKFYERHRHTQTHTGTHNDVWPHTELKLAPLQLANCLLSLSSALSLRAKKLKLTTWGFKVDHDR
jgi:hypothetical protein